MAGTTTNYSLPYPESTDLVASYPALGQDLAEDLDTILAAKAGFTDYATWTPTFHANATGWSFGTPTSLEGRWTRLGDTVLVDLYIEWGTGGTVGSGAFTLVPPLGYQVGSSFGTSGTGTGKMRRASDAVEVGLFLDCRTTARLTATGYYNSSGTLVDKYSLNTAGVSAGGIVPVANGDRWDMHWIYETSAS